MRLERISLRGLTTFGELVDIDTAALPSGVIAVTGENGTGKTTLLESMAAPLLERKFPSRNDGPLVDYATSRDAFIENTYTLDGRGTFRARVNLDGLKRTTDALLSQIHPDGQVTRLTDGKATTFDTKIAEIFPSKALLLSTVFASQNRRGSFLTASKAQRKDLFGELLGLQHFEAKAALAKSVANRLATLIAAKQAVQQRLAGETSEAVRLELDARAQTLTVELGRAEEQLEDLATEIDARTGDLRTARAFLDAKRAAAAALDAAVGTHAAKLADRAVVAARRAEADATKERDVQAARGRYQTAGARIDRELATVATVDALQAQYQAALDAIEGRLQPLLADLDARIEKNQGLISRAASVREAAATVKTNDAAIATATETIETAQRHLDTDQQRLRALELEHAKTAHVPVALDTARAAAALLERVPCGGAAPYDACSLLKNAIDAKASIDTLEAQLGDRNDQANAIADLAGAVGDTRNELDVARVDLANVKKATDALRPLAAELAFLEAAEQRIADYAAEKTRVTTDADAAAGQARQQFEASVAAAAERRRQLESELETAAVTFANECDGATLVHATTVKTIDRELLVLDVDLATLAAELAAGERTRENLEAAEEAVDGAEVNLQQAQETRSDLQGAMAALVERQAAHHREVATLQAKLAEHAAVGDLIRTIETDRIEFDLLAGAFGRDGLPTIEMDAAGPAVSDLCNDLLEAGLGSRRFTVELVTQEAKADGKGLKETFELKVTDSERGNEARDVTDLSGGEQVLLDESLKAAIAVFLNRRNERPLQTCWRDETTGALDPENALRYVAMLRRLQTLAGFHQIFMISHNPVVASLADVQLQVANGAVTIAYPPYAQEAA